MSMIRLENLTFAYPGSYDNIFENVSITIDTDWKLGFVGRNGRGKTTLLNLLLGRYEFSGKIESSVQFDYFPYSVENINRLTLEIIEEICPNALEWEIIKELSLMDTDAEILYREFATLSSGEQTKALLAALFLNDGHFLLIDEPTNHLDAYARESVSAYLKKKKGFILVSHDRRFLDGCVDHILALNRNGIDVQSGDFSSWMANFENIQKYEESENERLKKDIDRMRKAAERSSVWSDKTESSKYGTDAFDKGFIGHKSAKMMKRSKTIEKRRQQAIDEKSELLKNSEKAESLKLSPLVYRSDTLITLSSIEIFYGKNAVCKPVCFTVKRGDRIALNGKNGSGKSSILKLIMGENIKHNGAVTAGKGIKISYLPQDTSYLKGNLRNFAEQNNIDDSRFMTILRKMDFERVQFDKDMSDFSAGQKKKVLIAKSLCEQAHLYIWDEPLNYIDIYTRMQIEGLIKEFSPTMIFVEHDKAFKESVSTVTVELQ